MLHLRSLLLESSITIKKFKNKKIVEALKQNGSVKDSHRGTIKYITILKPENIFTFLKYYNYNIGSIKEMEDFIEVYYSQKNSREQLAKLRGNTKAKSVATKDGLYVAPLQKISVKLDGKRVELNPNQGMGYFIYHTQRLELYDTTTIVGIENYHNIWFAQNYEKLFKTKECLFVAINDATALCWLECQTNEYIHFGDYDLAGIDIYLHKVVPRLKKIQKYSFLIPENIEEFLQKGTPYLFKKQLRYKNISSDNESLQYLIDLIKKYKRGVEQEGVL